MPGKKRRTSLKYIDQLKPIVPPVERVISHLNRRMIEILYPEKLREKFTITIVFGHSRKKQYREAVELAKQAPSYYTKGEGRWLKHYAKYDSLSATKLFELTSLLDKFIKFEVLVQDKPLPYGQNLWLPLMWIFLP
ncbi:MAG: hypothetical protein OEZ30_00135 [Candidatus Aminicenantes bacterium]|nr:hypothetical protein [Candidatus Aminicenantes bacterium]MDH5713957.1 hypothetical protein [Candidatus Aminicenantes bacterium]